MASKNGHYIIAAIPCHNEEKYIGAVVGKTKQYVDEIVVVDDHSTDRTSEIAREAGAHVIRHETNMGAGAATRSCLQAGRDMNADILVTLDGDGQHNPDEIPDVIAPIEADEADLVIGSRYMGLYNNVPLYRRFGIWVITTLVNLGRHHKTSDGQSCFRAHNRRALRVLNITDNSFGFSVETLIQAQRANLRFQDVPISCEYHEDSHSMNPVFHGIGVALAVIKHRFKVSRKMKELEV